MVDRRLVAFVSAIAIVLAACGASTGRTAPSAEAIAPSASAAATGAGCVVGMSWASKSGRFPMWDEPAIQSAVAGAG